MSARSPSRNSTPGRCDRGCSALAGDERVNDATRWPRRDEFFREMRSDEAGAAGDEVVGHVRTLAIFVLDGGKKAEGSAELGTDAEVGEERRRSGP
jgi:hypothetical protein